MQKTTLSSAHFADTKPHYELLDGLRGVAALLVVVYHIFEGFAFAEATNGVGNGLITTLSHGHIAVDFFFMLSGFVISYAYDGRRKDMGIGSFFKRRLIRLHPMLVMGAIIGTAAFVFEGCKQWNGSVTPTTGVIAAMLFTMFMIPTLPGAHHEVRGNGEMFPLNGPTWSLFFEYIGNILYVLVIRYLPTKALALLAIALGIAHAWFFVGDVSGYDMVGVGWTIDSANFWGGLVRMLFPFTVGMLLARTYRPHKVKGAFWWCTALLVATFAMPYIEPAAGISTNSLYEVACIAVLFPAIVWIGAGGSCGDNVAGRINKFLGDISYPLYIVHYPIMYIFYKWLIKNKFYTFGETWGIAVLVIIASILLAYTLLKLYDEPMRRWLAKRFMDHK